MTIASQATLPASGQLFLPREGRKVDRDGFRVDLSAQALGRKAGNVSIRKLVMRLVGRREAAASLIAIDSH